MIEDVMAVCRRCHEAIHFGASIRVASGSLAAQGDTGKGFTKQWLSYVGH
jgi:hypothetical protein